MHDYDNDIQCSFTSTLSSKTTVEAEGKEIWQKCEHEARNEQVVAGRNTRAISEHIACATSGRRAERGRRHDRGNAQNEQAGNSTRARPPLEPFAPLASVSR